MNRWGNALTQALVIAGLVSLAGACARPRPHTVRVTTKPATPVVRPPPAEIRAVWVSDTAKLDWGTATARLQQAGFNTLYVNLASSGAAFYPSAIVPVVPGCETDPVAAGIRLARQRGLLVHAKLIVTFLFKTTPGFQQKLAATDRVMRDERGRPIAQAGYYWLCPSRETNRTHAASLVTEMLQRYPVDGLQFDYIRFNENPSCFCGHCRQQFERTLGQSVPRWPADALTGAFASRFQQWRVTVIDDWARELSAVARNARPGLVINAAVFPDLARARAEKGQDWRSWLDRGYLDYVCLMNYVTDPVQFDLRTRQTLATVAHPRQLVVGIGSWKFNDLAGVRAQIAATRRAGVPGFALFSYDDAAARVFLPDLAATRP